MQEMDDKMHEEMKQTRALMPERTPQNDLFARYLSEINLGQIAKQKENASTKKSGE
jgi:hypothetical protein